MKRIQLSAIALIMAMLISANYSGFFGTGSFLELVPSIEAVQYDVNLELERGTPMTVVPTTTAITTTTRKETTTTTTTTTTIETTTTTTTTAEAVTAIEEVAPVAIEETFNEEVTYEENYESNLYSTGERILSEESEEERPSNRAEWQEEWLPGFGSTVTYDDRDFQALCNVVQHEVGNCSPRSKYIVTSVILNRVIKGWDTSVWNVVTAPKQFSGVWNYVENVDYATQDTIDCVNYVLNSGIDFADGGTSFYNPTYCGYMSWFENQELVAEYEGHRYFR